MNGRMVGAIYQRARATELSFLAAAVAYYALLSILPALLLAMVLATAVGGEPLADRVLTASNEYLTPSGQELIEDAITNASGRLEATAMGFVVIVWSALRVFRGLDLAFSRVYDTTPSTTLFGRLRDGFVVLITIGVALWGMIGIGTLMATFDTGPATDLFSLMLLLVGLFVTFLPLYYVFPDADVTVRSIVPGTALTAVGWVGLQALYQLYASFSGGFAVYGVIGGVLLLVTWFYFAAGLLLVGAVVNVVTTTRSTGNDKVRESE